jgi:hypothetical protein
MGSLFLLAQLIMLAAYIRSNIGQTKLFNSFMLVFPYAPNRSCALLRFSTLRGHLQNTKINHI